MKYHVEFDMDTDVHFESCEAVESHIMNKLEEEDIVIDNILVKEEQ